MESVMEHAGRKVRFPDLHRFSDFFPDVEETDIKVKTDYGRLLGYPEWMDGSGQTFVVGGFLKTSPFPGRYFRVKSLPAWLESYIEENVLRCGNDTTSFAVYDWKDGRSLVTLEHSVILGNHYLGVIETDSLPEQSDG